MFVIFQGTVTKMRGRATTNPGRRFEYAAVIVSIFKANFYVLFYFFFDTFSRFFALLRLCLLCNTKGLALRSLKACCEHSFRTSKVL